VSQREEEFIRTFMKEKSEKIFKGKTRKNKEGIDYLRVGRGNEYSQNKNDIPAGGQQEVDITAALPEDLRRWGKINGSLCLELFRWLVDDAE